MSMNFLQDPYNFNEQNIFTISTQHDKLKKFIPR